MRHHAVRLGRRLRVRRMRNDVRQMLESRFGGARERIQIATKGGILLPPDGSDTRYDLSGAHLRRAIDDSLRRIGVEKIDIYYLHRPDPLAHPQDTAAALDEAIESGKIGAVGVSNYFPEQMRALMKYLNTPIVCNQLSLSLQRLRPFYEGWDFGENALREGRSGDGVLDFCMAENIVPIAYSPLGAGTHRAWRVAGRTRKKSRRNAASTRGKIRAHAGANRAGVAFDASIGHRAAGRQQRSGAYSRSRRRIRFAPVARRLVFAFHHRVESQSSVNATCEYSQRAKKSRTRRRIRLLLSLKPHHRATIRAVLSGAMWPCLAA